MGLFDEDEINAMPNLRAFKPASAEEKLNNYHKARELRKKIRDNQVPFIHPLRLDGNDFYLGQGLNIIGAESGKSKSTTCANLLAGFIQNCKGNAFVISNEESIDAVYQRTACVLAKVDFTKYFNARATKAEEELVENLILERVIPRCEVVEEGDFDMSYMEDVQSVLESAPSSNVNLVLIDYLQVIAQSRKQPDLESYQISKKLGFYLKDYGKKKGLPVVCFVQLNNSNDGGTMSSRIQNDKTFYNHGFLCVEAKPDFETSTTTFKIHKDRFLGCSGKEFTYNFNGGRLERMF